MATKVITKFLDSFPNHGFRSDGRIINLNTHNLIRNKRYIKLFDKYGHRQSINTERLFKELYPEIFGHPAKIKYLTKFNSIEEPQPESPKITNPDTQPIIYIKANKVIIKS